MVRERQDRGDLRRFVIGVDQHILRGLDLFLADIITDRCPDLILEEAGEIAGIEIDVVGQLLDGDPLMQIVKDIIDTLRDLLGADRVFSDLY